MDDGSEKNQREEGVLSKRATLFVVGAPDRSTQAMVESLKRDPHFNVQVVDVDSVEQAFQRKTAEGVIKVINTVDEKDIKRKCIELDSMRASMQDKHREKVMDELRMSLSEEDYGQDPVQAEAEPNPSKWKPRAKSSFKQNQRKQRKKR